VVQFVTHTASGLAAIAEVEVFSPASHHPVNVPMYQIPASDGAAIRSLSLDPSDQRLGGPEDWGITTLTVLSPPLDTSTWFSATVAVGYANSQVGNPSPSSHVLIGPVAASLLDRRASVVLPGLRVSEPRLMPCGAVFQGASRLRSGPPRRSLPHRPRGHATDSERCTLLHRL